MEMTKLQQREYEDAICALAEAMSNESNVAECAEDEIAKRFGVSVASVVGDVNDQLLEWEGERLAHPLGQD